MAKHSHEIIPSDPVLLIRQAIVMKKEPRGNFEIGSPKHQAYDEILKHLTKMEKLCDDIDCLENEYFS